MAAGWFPLAPFPPRINSSALRAHSVNLKPEVLGVKPPTQTFPDQCDEFLAEQAAVFHYPAAAPTEEMAFIGMAEFIVGMSLGEICLVEQPKSAKCLQGPIDRGQVNGYPPRLQELLDVFGTQVLLGVLLEDGENHLALAGEPQTRPLEDACHRMNCSTAFGNMRSRRDAF